VVERAESASAREVIRELCLDLRLFIDAQHQGTVGRIEVEPDDVTHPEFGPGQACRQTVSLSTA